MTKVLLLLGSQREGFNAALAETAKQELRALGATIATYRNLAHLPHYRPELDEAAVDPHVDEFRELVRGADALLLVTPEYNGGPSSLIKNAVDLASRPVEGRALTGKPAAVIGATPSRGATSGAREGLIVALQRGGASPIETTHGVASAHEKLTETGYDDQTRAAVQEVVAALLVAAREEQPSLASA